MRLSRRSMTQHFSAFLLMTTDMSLIEQCSLSVRYLNNSNRIVERFLQFIDVSKDQTAQGIADAVIQTLRHLNLSVRNIRGQGYDGASTMSGVHNGVQSIIRRIVPTASYVHCANHVLNLAVQMACSIPMIRNAFRQIKEVASFFHSAKRKSVLENHLSENRKLKSLCSTRWVESHEAIIVFLKLIIPVVKSLEDLSLTGGDTASKASSLCRNICSSMFLVSLHVMNDFSSLILPLSKALQSPNQDLLKSMSMVSTIIEVLRIRRENAESIFKKLFAEITEMAHNLEITIDTIRGSKFPENF